MFYGWLPWTSYGILRSSLQRIAVLNSYSRKAPVNQWPWRMRVDLNRFASLIPRPTGATDEFYQPSRPRPSTYLLSYPPRCKLRSAFRIPHDTTTEPRVLNWWWNGRAPRSHQGRRDSRSDDCLVRQVKACMRFHNLDADGSSHHAVLLGVHYTRANARGS